MKLGILVNTDKHIKHIIGISQAANSKGHEVSLFAMDEGTRLLNDKEFIRLCKLDNITISICNHSAEEQGVDTSGISKEIVVGSQFNNAMMNHEADHVIVL